MKNILKFIINKNFLISLIVIMVGAYFRISVSNIGYNFDMESWYLISKRDPFSQSVYSFTHRYNYGPIWSYVISFISATFETKSIEDLHLYLAFVMTLIDISIFILLYRIFGLFAGSLFYLNPISILISGFHIQIDNLAVLFGLIFWIIFIKSVDKEIKNILNFKFYIISLLFLGLSISIKHILIFLPFVLFLLFIKNENIQYKNIKNFIFKSLIVIIPYFVFITSFVIELLIHLNSFSLVLNGIYSNVFNYKSANGNSVIFVILKFFESITTLNIESFYIKYSLIIFLTLIVSIFIFNFKLIKFEKIFYLYLLIFYAFSPALADQYLIIPVVAFSAYSLGIFPFLFYVTGSMYLIFGSINNVANIYNPYHFDYFIFNKFYIYPQIFVLFFLILRFLNVLNLINVKIKLQRYYLFFIKYIYLIFFVLFSIFIFDYIKYHKESIIKIIKVIPNNECNNKEFIKKRIYSTCDNKNKCFVLVEESKKIRECFLNLKIIYKCERYKSNSEFILDSKIMVHVVDGFTFLCE